MAESESTRILLIEDDLKLTELIVRYLSQYGFDVESAADGKEGLELAESYQPHLIILDLMLPKMDGLTVCRELRAWFRGRIVILTASDEDMDQVASLEIGADDFVTKPIHPRVLLARIRMLLRREDSVIHDDAEKTTDSQVSGQANEFRYGELHIHEGRRSVVLNAQEINLTDAEFNLLLLLASNPETVLSRDVIVKNLRGISYDGLDRSIDNRIVSLRRKLGDGDGVPKRIITVRGKGYLFVTDKW